MLLFGQIEFQVLFSILLLSVAFGFVPKLIESIARHRKRYALRKIKKNLRNINDYDDDDSDDDNNNNEEKEEDHHNELYLHDNENKELKKKPKVNFLMNAISLAIGFQSNISLIGLPLEFYRHGFKTMQITLSLIAGPIVIAVFFIPFIYR